MLSKDEQPEHLIPTLEKLFNIIVGLLTEENVIIDLDVLGKITVHNKLVEIEPFVRHKKKLEGKMIVSQMVVNKQNSFRIKTKIKEANDIDEQREIRGQKLSVLNQSITSQSLKMQKIAYSPNLGATKSNIKSGFTKYLDMLGQVSDPLGRGYNFSDLIKSPNQLLKTNFIKSDFC